MRRQPEIPSDIEEYRDEHWRREATRQVETALDAERFIERVGFAACLTDSRRPGPSLYVAVCGRRDAVILNAGAALVAAGLASDVGAGVEVAAAAIDSGAAVATLECLVAFSNEVAV